MGSISHHYGLMEIPICKGFCIRAAAVIGLTCDQRPRLSLQNSQTLSQSKSGIMLVIEDTPALLDAFKVRFGTSASIYRAPGRVNVN